MNFRQWWCNHNEIKLVKAHNTSNYTAVNHKYKAWTSTDNCSYFIVCANCNKNFFYFPLERVVGENDNGN